MTSLLTVPFPVRAAKHPNPVARRLFEIAENKKLNLVVSADLTDSKSPLACADSYLGPYIAVLKTHVDLVSDFDQSTARGLRTLAKKHNFAIFEDHKLVDIGNTVQKQYHGGVLRLPEWADIVNLSVLGGDGIVEALEQMKTAADFPFLGQRAFLLLGEMTSKGSLATGVYTQKCIDLARKFPRSMIGFVATRALSSGEPAEGEDFLVFTTGVNLAGKGDKLGQQYQTPVAAVEGGADFIIAGRGIYAAADPVEVAKSYREEGLGGLH